MPSIILKKYSEPTTFVQDSLADKNAPFSFEDWSKRNFGIIPDNSKSQYEDYLLDWYRKKRISLTPTSLRDDYLNLIKRLSVIFRNDSDFRQFSNIDVDDELQLKLAVPHYVRKLKEIALYYRDKRESIKRAKLKYNMIGSFNSIERTFHEYLQKAFSKRDYVLNVPEQSAWNAFPDLTAINNGFSIELESLYDDKDYFRDDLESNSTGVYELTSSNPLLFVLDDIINEIYQTSFIENVPLSAKQIPFELGECASIHNINLESLQIANEKYIGTDKFYLSGGLFVEDSKPVSLNFKGGNNFFYWFSGEYFKEAPHANFLHIPINSIDWVNAGATSSPYYSSSDILFMETSKGNIEGAWLANSSIKYIDDTMKATLRDRRIFKYPYPGIGVSAEGLEWGGKSVSDFDQYNKTFFPNVDDVVGDIESIYWTTTDSISTVNSISIHDTSLVANGAHASNKFHNADKILTRSNVSVDGVHDTTPDEIFNGDYDVDWLYDFKRTQLPITAGKNNIYWPLQTFNTIDELSLEYPDGHDIALEDISVSKHFAGAVAGNSPETSDIIYKLESWCGPVIEVAWLAGLPLSAMTGCSPVTQTIVDNLTSAIVPTTFTRSVSTTIVTIDEEGLYNTGTIQSALTLKADPGSTTRFLWTGGTEAAPGVPSGDFFANVDINYLSAFAGHNHDDTCPYKNIKNKTPLQSSTSFKSIGQNLTQWKQCTCKAIWYSPFGHTGSKYTDNRGLSDYIIRDTSYPLESSLNEWVGGDGLSWDKSSDFAWYKLDDNDPDIQSLTPKDGGRVGWGKGQWVTGSGKPFLLRPSERYLYFRTGLKGCSPTDPIGGIGPRVSAGNSPYFITSHSYCGCRLVDCACVEQNCTPIWKRAILKDGKYVDAKTTSKMVMESNSFYVYEHRDSYEYSTIDTSTDEAEETFVCTPSINFMISVPLKSSVPYWAKGSFGQNSITHYKGVMYNGEVLDIKFEYLLYTLPEPSDLILVDNMFLEYRRSLCADTPCFVWEEPLKWTIEQEEDIWNELIFDNCIASPILNKLQRNNCEACNKLLKKCPGCCEQDKTCECITYLCETTRVGVIATNTPSEIILKTAVDTEPVFINYWAQTPFNLEFTVVDTTKGTPPTGGVWIPPNLVKYSTALAPNQNIVNLFNPIVASSQLIAGLYTKRDSGFFTPDKLGYTSVVLQNKTIDISIDPNRTISSSSVVISPDHYVSGPYSVKFVDSTWMKKSSGASSGRINNAADYQEFVPYQTSFESLKINSFGIQTQSDLKSPWDGELDGTLRKDDRFTPNIKGDTPICCGPNTWYYNQPSISGVLYQWKPDVYGNQYGLYKETGPTIYQREISTGHLWVKDLISNVAPSKQLLARVFDTYSYNSTVYSALTSGNIQSFDLFYDTIMIQLPENILFERLNVDFDTGEIYSIADESCLFDVVSSSNCFAPWLSEDSKTLVFGYLSGDVPIIYRSHIDKAEYKKVFPVFQSDSTDWDQTFTYTRPPKLTYNKENNSYNLTFKAGVGGDDVIVTSDFTQEDTRLVSGEVQILIVPDISGKELIRTRSYNDKLLLIFEEQTTPNIIHQVIYTR